MLTFTSDTHQYFWNSIPVPSVTQIIEDAGLSSFDKVPWHILKKAAEIGTYVHKAADLYDSNTLDFANLDDFLLPFLEAWQLFLKETGMKILQSEKKLYSQKYGFAGTLDRLGIIQEEEALIDIKTGVKSISHGVQLAAYEQLCKENKLTEKRRLKRITVKLKENGSYSIDSYKDRSDFAVFLNALAINKFKNKLR